MSDEIRKALEERYMGSAATPTSSIGLTNRSKNTASLKNSSRHSIATEATRLSL